MNQEKFNADNIVLLWTIVYPFSALYNHYIFVAGLYSVTSFNCKTVMFLLYDYTLSHHCIKQS